MADDSTMTGNATAAGDIGSPQTLERLSARIAERRSTASENSYTARLCAMGVERIRQKVGEEAVEVILARKPAELVSEIADLLYHVLLLLEISDVPAQDVYAELERRLQASS